MKRETERERDRTQLSIYRMFTAFNMKSKIKQMMTNPSNCFGSELWTGHSEGLQDSHPPWRGCSPGNWHPEGLKERRVWVIMVELQDDSPLQLLQDRTGRTVTHHVNPH